MCMVRSQRRTPWPSHSPSASAFLATVGKQKAGLGSRRWGPILQGCSGHPHPPHSHAFCRVDEDSALHSDLQILKEKEGADFILLNFTFKVRLPCGILAAAVVGCRRRKGRQWGLTPLLPSPFRITFPLIHPS